LEKLELTTLLIGKEPVAITRALAMMAYNPAIGRVLESGFVTADLKPSGAPATTEEVGTAVCAAI
jgi:hypothetical protein